jgi:hypothetical protein
VFTNKDARWAMVCFPTKMSRQLHSHFSGRLPTADHLPPSTSRLPSIPTTIHEVWIPVINLERWDQARYSFKLTGLDPLCWAWHDCNVVHLGHCRRDDLLRMWHLHTGKQTHYVRHAPATSRLYSTRTRTQAGNFPSSCSAGIPAVLIGPRDS